MTSAGLKGEYSSDNRVVLLPASGRGIGAACARHLASENYKLVLLSPSGSAKKLASELGAIGLTGSITDTADLKAMVDTALAEFGRIDGLVLNTGILSSSLSDKGDAISTGPAYDPQTETDPSDISDEDWLHGFEMMFLSAVRMLRLVGPVFRSQGGGAVVSISTFSAPEPRLSYPVSSCLRASLAAFVKLYADRFARDRIRINSVLPGFIENWEQPPEVIDAIPMARLGRAQEVAEAVAFLLSDRASYITGQSILVDGGVNRSF